MSNDDALNDKESGVEIVLEGPNNILIEQSLKFEFKASNYQTEYGALIVEMDLSLDTGASRLKAKRKSQLVANQITGEY